MYQHSLGIQYFKFDVFSISIVFQILKKSIFYIFYTHLTIKNLRKYTEKNKLFGITSRYFSQFLFRFHNFVFNALICIPLFIFLSLLKSRCRAAFILIVNIFNNNCCGRVVRLSCNNFRLPFSPCFFTGCIRGKIKYLKIT